MDNNLDSVETTMLKQLCLSSIQAAVNKLCEVGAWPRPKRSRILQIGRDIYEEEFDDLVEFKSLIDFLASQENIKSMYLDERFETFSRRILRDYWLRFLLNVLADTNGEIVSERTFTKWFKRFVKELYCETDLWRAIYVFDGMELNGNSFQLDKFTRLMPASEGTLKSLIPWHESIPWYDRYFSLPEILNTDKSLSSNGNAILVITKKLPKEYHGSPWPAGRDFDSRERAFSALAAIRLTQPGSVYMEFWGEFKVSKFRVLDPIGLDAKPDFGLRSCEYKVNVKENDFYQIRSVWKELMNSGYAKFKPKRQSPPTRMEIAQDRFFKSYEANDWYESLLDLTIALEALFNPQDKDELRHRIAMRCAWLLDTGGNTSLKTNNNNLFDSIRTLYDLRSNIVHGGTPSKKNIERMIKNAAKNTSDSKSDWELGEAAVEIARDITRHAIGACSNLGKLPTGGPHWPFEDGFDQSMIVSSEQKRWQKAAGVEILSKRIKSI